MKLLLTHGYFLHEDAKEPQIMKPSCAAGDPGTLSSISARERIRCAADLRFHVRFA